MRDQSALMTEHRSVGPTPDMLPVATSQRGCTDASACYTSSSTPLDHDGGSSRQNLTCICSGTTPNWIGPISQCSSTLQPPLPTRQMLAFGVSFLRTCRAKADETTAA